MEIEGTTRRVLVVDEDEDVRTVTTLALSASAWVDGVASTQAGLQRLGRNDYDAVVLDAQLNTLSAITLFRQLRDQHEMAVIILTRPSGPMAALAAMVDDCLFKPVADDELVRRVEAAIDKRYAVAPRSRLFATAPPPDDVERGTGAEPLDLLRGQGVGHFELVD